MRTTLDIADDVLLAAKEVARKEKKTAGQVISDLARQALTGGDRRITEEQPEPFYGFQPLPRRGGIVTNELVRQLLDADAY
jgi:hypothetical protein